MPVNESEERLLNFTKKTFLSMWSHSNIFYKKGKEFSDVMVVFGNHVIIMSDKLINNNIEIDEKIAWNRWYKSAIESSLKQLNGAYNHINSYPDNLYTDAQATEPFSMELPHSDEICIHLIAIANGCSDACYRKHGRYGLNIDTACTGKETLFTIGIPTRKFVHIFNDSSLDKIFTCLDTTRDFIDYIQARENLLTTSDKHINIYGEEELLAAWMLRQPDNAPFHMPYELFRTADDIYHIGPGLWERYNSDENQRIRQKTRKNPYTIDNLIDHIHTEYENQSLIIGQDESINYHERAFKLLASELRLGRQLISIPLIEIAQEDPRFFWANIVESNDFPGLLYLWLIYPEMPEDVSDDIVINILPSQLSKYLLVAQSKFRDMKIIFGACLPNIQSSRRDRLFIVNNASHWNEEMQKISN